MKTFSIRTLGCKVNQYESQSIREQFSGAGYTELDFAQACDVYVINSCTVTSRTDKETRRLIRDVRRRSPRAIIAVTGCLVEMDRDDRHGTTLHDPLEAAAERQQPAGPRDLAFREDADQFAAVERFACTT